MTTHPGEATEALDVRVFVPIERHTRLLKMFGELPVGESFVFINDHDPLPLYYELRSIHGDVVDWEYLHRGGVDWKVKVTRTQASKGREFAGVSTLMDLRKIDEKDWKHVVLHRFGMMPAGDTMELVAERDPRHVAAVFEEKLGGRYDWVTKKDEPGEYVVHITKRRATAATGAGVTVVGEFDIRPFPPAKRHEMVFTAFDELLPGEAFVFTNDHDPKPLYYQLEAESRQPFTWEYLLREPEVWRVKVAKTKE